MKKKLWLSAVCLFLAAPALTWAEDTNSIQLLDRQILTLGDKAADMESRMNASPIKVASYPLPEAEKPDTLAVDYTYEIENMQYVITIVDDYVYKIKKESLDK